MHAGDALWFIYAGLAALERRQASEPRALIMLQRMRECAKTIGEFMGIPEPPTDKLNQLIDQLAHDPDAGTLDPTEPAEPNERPRGNSYNDDENINFARELLDAMVASDYFDWSEFVNDLHAKLQDRDKAFFTPKQWRGIVRTAQSNDEFWEMFEADNPECVEYARRKIATLED